jgi:hypothetical protein
MRIDEVIEKYLSEEQIRRKTADRRKIKRTPNDRRKPANAVLRNKSCNCDKRDKCTKDKERCARTFWP